MRSIQKIAYCLALITMLAQFSSNESSINGSGKPSVNFFGIITDDSHNTHEAHNITISGIYKQIPVYAIPPKQSFNPERNVSRVDLSEIKELHVPHLDGGAKLHSFANKQYVEIQITYNDEKRTATTYIIERSRKVRFDKVNQAGSIESELSIEALDTLKINGYKKCEIVTHERKL
jgi:hypothetical protein